MKYGMYLLVGCALSCLNTPVVLASMTRAVMTQQQNKTASLEKSKRLIKRVQLQAPLGIARTNFITAIIEYRRMCRMLTDKNEKYQKLKVALDISVYEDALQKLALDTLARMPVGTSEFQLINALKESFPRNCPQALVGPWSAFFIRAVRYSIACYEE